MTLASLLPVATASGNGVATIFPVPFKIFTANALAVYSIDNDPASATYREETLLTMGTDYSVSGVGLPAGCTVTFVTAPSSGVDLLFTSVTTLEQATAYSGSAFPASAHENALDKAMRINQEQQLHIMRSLRFPLQDGDDVSPQLPPRGVRASKMFGFDADGDILMLDNIDPETVAVLGDRIADLEAIAPEIEADAAAADASRIAAQAAQAAAASARDVTLAVKPALESNISALETGLMSLAMKQAVQAGDADRSILMNGWLDPLTDASQAALTVMGFQTKDTGYIESLKGGTNVALNADVAGDTGNTDVVNGGVEIPAPGVADAYYIFQLPAVNVVNVTALKAALATATVPANSKLRCAVSFDGGTIWNRYDPTTKWTAVAYRNGTTWYYRASGGSWTASPVNTLQGALLYAMSVAANRWNMVPPGYTQTTTNVLTGGTATASHTDAGAPGNLMDGNLATYWRSPYVGNCLPVWLKYQLAAAKRTWKYRLYMSTDQYPAGYTPHAWTLEGSNDNANWTTLDTQSGQTWSAAGWKEYEIPEANRGSWLYYRLYITAGGVESANYMWLYEWQMYEEVVATDSLGTAQVCTGGTASASLGTAANAFDNDDATFWRTSSTTSGWLRYTWAAAKKVWRYRFKTYPASAKCPKNWTFEGSNDGTNWTVLDTHTGVTDYGETVVWRPYYEIPEASRGLYTMYRINVSECVNASHDPALTELEMNEATTIPSTDYLTGLAQAQWHDSTGEQLGFRPGVTSSVQVAGAMLKTSTSGSPRLSALSFTVDRTAADGAAEFDAFEALDPDIGRAVFVMQAVDSITLDTDVKAWMKRGAGAYVQAPLVLDSAYDATRVLVRGELDMSATPGTTTQLKLTTHNNKAVRIFQAANYFKSK